MVQDYLQISLPMAEILGIFMGMSEAISLLKDHVKTLEADANDLASKAEEHRRLADICDKDIKRVRLEIAEIETAIEQLEGPNLSDAAFSAAPYVVQPPDWVTVR